MNLPQIILGIVGAGIIFAIAAWLGPKFIRAIYPEEQHERMIALHRGMVIIGIGVAVLAVISVLAIQLLQ